MRRPVPPARSGRTGDGEAVDIDHSMEAIQIGRQPHATTDALPAELREVVQSVHARRVGGRHSGSLIPTETLTITVAGRRRTRRRACGGGRTVGLAQRPVVVGCRHRRRSAVRRRHERFGHRPLLRRRLRALRRRRRRRIRLRRRRARRPLLRRRYGACCALPEPERDGRCAPLRTSWRRRPPT